MRVLVVNGGSSSVKAALLDGTSLVGTAEADLPEAGRAPDGLLDDLLGPLVATAEAAGHRVVHGGAGHRGPAVVTPELVAELEELSELAPLHQPVALAGLAAVARLAPGLASVACFDTAFHATLPEEAATFALPSAWRERFGLRRVGFHGLSHAWASRRAAELAGLEVGSARTVSCHLGAGASLAAVAGGRSVDTTMGFTPLDGLVMATRSGSLDPGILLHLLAAGVSPAELSDGLEHRSGLVGLAGTADMAEVIRRAVAGDEAAELALGVYCHRLAGLVAAMAASMGGVDLVSFTGGVGEHAPEVRRRVGARLGFLGLVLDDEANRSTRADGLVSAPSSPVAVAVVTAREDLEIAAQTRAVLGGAP